MSVIFITCVLHCCTQVLSPTIEWTQQDKKALNTAQVHCRVEKPSKCLIKFKKVEEAIYTAICGKENN